MDAHPGSQNLCEKNSGGTGFRLSHYSVVYGSLQGGGIDMVVRGGMETLNRQQII